MQTNLRHIINTWGKHLAEATKALMDKNVIHTKALGAGSWNSN